MALTEADINLGNLLKFFTFVGDPDPQGKTQIPIVDFLHIASLLKLSVDLQRIGNNK